MELFDIRNNSGVSLEDCAELQIIARGNPLTYEVDALRGAMLFTAPASTGC